MSEVASKRKRDSLTLWLNGAAFVASMFEFLSQQDWLSSTQQQLALAVLAFLNYVIRIYRTEAPVQRKIKDQKNGG